MMRNSLSVAALTLTALFLFFSTYAKAEELHPKESQESYVIKGGDTLWSLSEYFYNNPFLWPKLWASNPDIENPHIIYPDTKLKLKSEKPKKRIVEKIVVKEVIKEVKVPVKKRRKTAKAAPARKAPVKAKKPEAVVKIAKNQTPSVDKGILAYAGYLVKDSPKGVAFVLGEVEQRLLIGAGSTIYISEGSRKGLKKGDIYSVVSVSQAVVDKNGRVNGYIIKILGEVAISDVYAKRQSKALVLNSYGEIEKGNLIVPLHKFSNAVKVNKDAPDVKNTRIVAAKNELVAIGERDVVYLNKGADTGIKAGNRFDIYRGDYKTAHPKYKNTSVRLPSEAIGELTVVYTTEKTATAVVSFATQEIMISDTVQKRK